MNGIINEFKKQNNEYLENNANQDLMFHFLFLKYAFSWNLIVNIGLYIKHKYNSNLYQIPFKTKISLISSITMINFISNFVAYYLTREEYLPSFYSCIRSFSIKEYFSYISQNFHTQKQNIDDLSESIKMITKDKEKENEKEDLFHIKFSSDEDINDLLIISQMSRCLVKQNDFEISSQNEDFDEYERFFNGLNKVRFDIIDKLSAKKI